MKKRNVLVYLLTGCVLTASMSVGTTTAVHAEAATTSAAAVEPGTNMYAAGELTLNTPVSGTIEGSDDYAWYSFTTEAEAGAEYQISCVNGTPGSNLLYFDIFDEMGAVLHSGEADSNGLPGTIITGDLQPDTTYYIRLSISDMGTRDYIVLIKTTKEDSKKAAAADGKAAADAEASTTKAE